MKDKNKLKFKNFTYLLEFSIIEQISSFLSYQKEALGTPKKIIINEEQAS